MKESGQRDLADVYRLNLDHAVVAIRTARPGLTVRARAVVEAILLSKGPIGTAEHVAHALGLKNRFRLARLLHNEGLPPLHRLAEWLTIFSWVSLAQREGVSLCWMAFRMHRHPSACYRLVKQVTGLGWEELQTRGEAWVLDQFLKELDRVGSLAKSAKPSPSPTSPAHKRSSSRLTARRRPAPIS